MLSGLKKKAADAAEKVRDGMEALSVTAEIELTKRQISGLKNKFGVASFDLAVAGDLAAVKALADAEQPKIAALQAKIDRLRGGAVAGSTPESAVAAQMTVTVPPGVGPGQQFMAMTASGESVVITVPANAAAGQSIVVDVPEAVPIAMGVPID
jgi:hypothetical protein